MANYQYAVETVRETLVGDKINTDGLQEQLNGRAASGWRLVHAFGANVKGRLGPGGTSGVVLIFERERGVA